MALQSRGTGGVLVAAGGALMAWALLGAHSHPAPLRHLPPAPALAPASAEPSASSGPLPPPAPAADGGAAGEASPPRFAEPFDVSTFQKGNIHTHTTRSDGDRPPQDVYRWYRDHGYNFVAITDHNTLTDPAIFRLLERKRRFAILPGEEITMRGAGKQVHVNAICHRETIGGRTFDTQREALAWGVRQVLAQGGIALVNHPNWDWALVADDLPAARGAQLLEIWSGHPYVHTLGDDTHLSHEAIWDRELTAGETFAGVAVDDAHAYGASAPETAARPGRAWIQVFAPEASRKAICAALAGGRLYASTGPVLRRIHVTERAYAVYPADPSAEVEFVGKGGAVLQHGKAGADGAARYELQGGEGYVRARITTADGKHAWTQASRLGG